MFKIEPITKQIHITRGDIGTIQVTARNEDGSDYIFHPNEVVRLNVFGRKACGDIKLRKDITVIEETTTVNIELETNDTRFGAGINTPTDYWYEIEINPETVPQTIIGYDEDGAKIFRVYPEGYEVVS